MVVTWKVSADGPQGPGQQIQTNSSLDDGYLTKHFSFKRVGFAHDAKHLEGIIVIYGIFDNYGQVVERGKIHRTIAPCVRVCQHFHCNRLFLSFYILTLNVSSWAASWLSYLNLHILWNKKMLAEKGKFTEFRLFCAALWLRSSHTSPIKALGAWWTSKALAGRY